MQANPDDRSGQPQHADASSDGGNRKLWGLLAGLGLVGGITAFVILNQPAEEQRVAVPVPPPVAEPTPAPVPEPVTTPVATAPEPVAEPVIEPVTPEPVAVEEPAPEVSAPPAPEPEPLPTLNNSDTLAAEQATGLTWLGQFKRMLVPQEIVRNFVTFIDNLARGQLETKYSPITRPNAAFAVREEGDRMFLDPKSFQRYDIYVDIINSIDIEQAMRSYRLLEPLLQQAYGELGYPDQDFSLILQQALQTMLDAPIIEGEIELVAPSAMYQFADAGLEALPAAQKLMIRLGSANNVRVRPKLQQLQAALFVESESRNN